MTTTRQTDLDTPRPAPTLKAVIRTRKDVDFWRTNLLQVVMGGRTYRVLNAVPYNDFFGGAYQTLTLEEK